MSTKINVEGRRLVKNDKIAQIGQGGGGSDINLQAGTGISITTGETAEDKVIAVNDSVVLTTDLATVATTGAYSDLTGTPTIPAAVSGTNDGTNWTSITIGDTTKAIPAGGSSSESPIKVLSNPVTIGPSANDADVITAWIKSLPVLVGRNTSITETLRGMGFTNEILSVAIGEMVQLRGYFAAVVESTTSPYDPTKLVVCTTENRTGTNTLVNRNCSNIMLVEKCASQEWKTVDARYRGDNTSLSAGIDPIGLSTLEVYSLGATPGKAVVLACRSDRNFIKEYWFNWKVTNPSPVDYAGQTEAPTTAGTYRLTVTVDANGEPTFAWVAETV